MAIHPTAVVSKDLIIDESTEIGPYVIIEENVKIGKNNKIMAHAYIGQGTTIGNGNVIHMGAVLGHEPQDKKFTSDQKTFLYVGDNNIIREYVTIHRGCVTDFTKIGNDSLLMGCCHVAHDCRLGDSIIMANMSALGGHVVVADNAFISGGAMVHQFVQIGRFALLSGNSRISMDVPPFVIAAEKNQVWGINVVGLKRNNFSSELINKIKKLYRIFFKRHLSQTEILEEIKQDPSFSSPEVEEFIKFVENSNRGVCRAS